MISAQGLTQLGFTPEVDFTLRDNGDGVVYIEQWLSGSAQPSEADITTAHNTWQTSYDALDYSRKRKTEYDQLNQFELISDDSINGTTTHKDAITAIKTKYPKG
jgi:hypothetical protein